MYEHDKVNEDPRDWLDGGFSSVPHKYNNVSLIDLLLHQMNKIKQ